MFVFISMNFYFYRYTIQWYSDIGQLRMHVWFKKQKRHKLRKAQPQCTHIFAVNCAMLMSSRFNLNVLVNKNVCHCALPQFLQFGNKWLGFFSHGRNFYFGLIISYEWLQLPFNMICKIFDFNVDCTFHNCVTRNRCTWFENNSTSGALLGVVSRRCVGGIPLCCHRHRCTSNDV